jgi:hypothetical protein
MTQTREATTAESKGDLPKGHANDSLGRSMVPLPPLETARYTVDQGIATITLDRP